MLRQDCVFVEQQRLFPQTTLGWFYMAGQLLVLLLGLVFINFDLGLIIAELIFTAIVLYSVLYHPGRITIWVWIGQLFAVAWLSPTLVVDYELLCPGHVIARQLNLTIAATIIPPIYFYAWSRENWRESLRILLTLLVGLIVLRYATMISATTCASGGGVLEPHEIGFIDWYSWSYWLYHGDFIERSAWVVFNLSAIFVALAFFMGAYFSFLFRIAGWLKRRFFLS